MTQPTQSVQATPPALQSKGRVLVVDDEPALRRLNSRILATTGYTVVQAGDGVEAGAALEAQRFDAVLTDICMPGMNGIQLLRRIRALDPDVPVLLLTGSPDVDSAI